MLLSYQWLKEWVPAAPPPDALAELLTARGFPVDSVQPRARFSGVVVGKVVERARHPNADRLSLCKVDVGGQVLEIVCGAPNARAGITVAVALDGAQLPGGVLRKSKIRGVLSNGMMCSGRELELSEEHAGILELDPALTPGDDFARAAGLDDTALEVDIPHNRGDALCVRGLAREVAAALGEPLRSPLRALPVEPGALPGVAGVEIEDPADCPRYAARVVQELQVGPSPPWLRLRVESLGMRSINNVVDATNFTMLELGQPIHAFNLAKVRGGRLGVRRARPGERLRTLDAVDRELPGETLLIVDPEGPLALAGLMGGEASEVRPDTRAVLLESACFGPARVRQGAQKLRLASEAGRRFERGTDPEVVLEALDRVASLLAEVAGGRVLPQRLDAWPGRAERRRVALRPARARMLLALPLPRAELEAPLRRLGFELEPGGAGEDAPIEARVPSWRVDVGQEVDLVEEIARHRGYLEIPEDPGSVTPRFGTRRPAELFRDHLRGTLMGLGFFEAQCPSLVAPEDVASAPVLPPEARRAPLALENPLSREFSLLRPSLLPGLLRAVSHNARHGRRAVRLFELGHVFLRSPRPLPEEPETLGLALFGPRHASGFGLGPDLADWYDLKGVLEALLGALRIDNPESLAYDGDGFKPGCAAELRAVGVCLGYFGEVAPALLERLEIPGPTYLAELDVAALERTARLAGMFREWSRFPSVKRDLAFLVPVETPAAALQRDITDAGGTSLKAVRLFDVYAGERVATGLKNLAFSLEFQSAERTLSDAEVDQAVGRVVRRLEEQHGARLR
ncbi:MAG TPA: phenylalanine--tRNA ligase subunit beta [Candidatus Saccharimonadales bacterium]|nr:phenylalanine--tRNA ligase subunit beta [Candidatus Saccharimonadales bacterium]